MDEFQSCFIFSCIVLVTCANRSLRYLSKNKNRYDLRLLEPIHPKVWCVAHLQMLFCSTWWQRVFKSFVTISTADLMSLEQYAIRLNVLKDRVIYHNCVKFVRDDRIGYQSELIPLMPFPLRGEKKPAVIMAWIHTLHPGTPKASVHVRLIV